MPMAERTATVVWKGDLAHGSGMVTAASGAFAEFPVTWASRTERSDGKTSPEELIAAAHASCFSMGLSFGLAQAGHPPESLEVKATCTFDAVDGVPTITAMHLDVTGKVPGLDGPAFEAAAQGAKEGCPVSRALKGNVAISMAARLG
jgi:lipoyl-dependent peroxiredoxin